MIKHKQLTIKERKELALSAIEHGINYAANLYGKHYNTVKRWTHRYLNDESFENIVVAPLNVADNEYLDTFKPLVGRKSLQQIKTEFNIPFSIDTLAHYYRDKNIIIKAKHIILYRCPECKLKLRAINVFFGRPRKVSCPSCSHDKLERQEYLKIPFYNPRPEDYFFNKSRLMPINSDMFKEVVQPLLKIPKDLKCLMVYTVRPRKFNRIHLIKHFVKKGDNTVPVTYCNVEFPIARKREILNPRSNEIDTGMICQNCQISYLRHYKKYGDKFPETIEKLPDSLQIAIELFILARRYNNKIACILMGITKKGFYRLKKQYTKLYEAVEEFAVNENSHI